MAVSGRNDRALHPAVWLAAALPALIWIAIAGQLHPSLILTAAVAAVAVLLGACAAAAVRLLTQPRPVPIRVESTRTVVQQRLRDADASGSPRSGPC